ncbi:MAG: hypothetical protein ABIJ91_02675 [Candidatus Kuenenbacteria bacterium]
MFDDQPNKKQDTASEFIQPNMPTPVPSPQTNPSVNAPAAAPAAETKEPDDIFAVSDPAPKPNVGSNQPIQTTSADISVKKPAVAALSTQTSEELEPAIKSTPSVFTPKSSSSGQLVPDTARQPKAGKNIVFLIVILLIACLAIASIIWWFVSRSQKQPASNVVMEALQNSLNTNTNLDTQDKIKEELPQEKNSLSDIPKDSDGDGLSDEDEIMYGTSLNSSDTDGDGLFDREEIQIYKTDPLKTDTDNDGIDDRQEVLGNTDPLVEDNDSAFYKNDDFKFELELLPDMIIESVSNNVVRFNNNIDQIKFYIFIDNDNIEQVSPDIEYTISQNSMAELIITGSQPQPDKTPSSTVFGTNYFLSGNGHRYLIRYVATKKGQDHQANFETMLSSFKFL